MSLPQPPMLKTTIIQLNKDIDPEDNNYEVLTNDYMEKPATAFNNAHMEEPPKRKRRRSSQLLDDDELERRKSETRQIHSLIEKRRRIKINREFEALKSLIPACRAVDGGAKAAKSNGNNSKIDGMYKLTILKTSVEYILYLHHIVQKQHQMLAERDPEYQFDTAFSQTQLDVNCYRNIDREFDFHSVHVGEKRSISSISETDEHDARYAFVPSPAVPARLTDCHLPSPKVTPQIVPQTYRKESKENFKDKEFREFKELKELKEKDPRIMFEAFDMSTSRPVLRAVPTATSPFTRPTTTQMHSTFLLPDPALPTGARSSTLDSRRSSADVPRSNSHPEASAGRARDSFEAIAMSKKSHIGTLLN